jgi:hypothetical integral membrane protein (TIGR02206 family)
MHPIQIFGPSHLAALGATILVWIILFLSVKFEKGWTRWAEISLAVVLLSQWLVRSLIARWLGYFNPLEALPIHLCDVVSILGGIALLTRRQALIELTYFWGLAGTLNGVITPNLNYDFPHPEYFGFFLLHSGVVVAALHMTLAWKKYPGKNSVLRAVLWINIYILVAALVNWSTGSNYAFLRARPENTSLMSALPEPPWHLLVLEPLAIFLFCLLYLPFWRRNRSGHLTALEPTSSESLSADARPSDSR